MIRRTKIRRVSAKRAKQLAQYGKLRKAYLTAHPDCQLCEQGEEDRSVSGRATEIHHREGRIGAKLTDPSHFMALCAQHHRFIHSHPSEARARGWLK